MPTDLERQIAAVMAKAMALICVRNTQLETLHAGPGPVSHSGDYSDVIVTDANGRQIPWPEVSRISDAEMRELMREIVNRLYTFQLRLGEEELRDYLDRQLTSTRNWDEPKLDWNLAGRNLREATGADAAERPAPQKDGAEPR